MTKELEEKIVSDDGYSTAADAVTGAGGAVKSKKADLNKSVDPTADTVNVVAPGNTKGGSPKETTARKDLVTKTVALPEGEEGSDEAIVEEVVEIDEAVAALFEGEELSEDFKKKASLIFSAAIHEAVTAQVEEEVAALKEAFDTELSESVTSAMDEIVESLDGYLDYVVKEWMSENEIAIEAGIKVEMAESFMEGLKGLFYEHNVAIDETTIDVVGSLEAELAEAIATANQTINENVALNSQLAALQAEKVFTEVTEGLTVTQAERLRVLSEKISHDDLTVYASDLKTLKESFFKSAGKKDIVESVATEDEGGFITEDTVVATSPHATVNAYVAAINARKK